MSHDFLWVLPFTREMREITACILGECMCECVWSDGRVRVCACAWSDGCVHGCVCVCVHIYESRNFTRADTQTVTEMWERRGGDCRLLLLGPVGS